MRAPVRALAALLVAMVAAGWLPAARARRGGRPTSPRPVLGSEVAPCGDTCDYLALPDPEKPETGSTNTAKGVKVILSGVFGAMTQAAGPVKFIGGLGAGILAGLEDSPADPAWETYKMQVYIKQSTDLLLCKMDAMVNGLNLAADQRMNDADLDSFNNGIDSIMGAFYESCGAMNCLNVTRLPPSRRNAAAGGLDCAYKVATIGTQTCPKGVTFNPDKLRTCLFNNGGQPATGVCDPDGHCYDVYTHTQAVNTLKEVVALFASKDTVNNFNAFSSWLDTKATVALAKGALAKVLLLQQLVMLDGASGTNAQLRQFAGEMADKLEARYKITLDPERLLRVVNSVSRPNMYHENYAPDNVEWPFPRGNRQSCACGSVTAFNTRYSYRYFMYPNHVVTVKGKVRNSCQDEGTTFSKRCIPVYRYFLECGYYTTAIGLHMCNAPNNIHRCDGAWDRCVSVDNDNGDWSDFVGPFEDLQKANGSPTAGCHGWQCLPALQWSNHLINSAPRQRLLQSANHAARVLQPMLSSAHYLQSKGKLARDRCPDVVSTVDTLVRAAADKLARDLTADLEPVRDIIATLRNISSTGMPESTFGILRTTYPLLGGKCDSSTRDVALGAPRPLGTGVWQNRLCPTNCQQCRPSWRCLKCRNGYRLRLSGLMCTKI